MLDAAIVELLSGEKQDVTDIEREAANAYNDHFVDYCFAQLEAEVGYYSEVVAAMEVYSEAVSTAEQEAQHAILVAEHVLDDAVTELDQRWDDALEILHHGGDLGGEHFSLPEPNSPKLFAQLFSETKTNDNKNRESQSCPHCFSNNCDAYSSSLVTWSLFRKIYTGNGRACDNLYYASPIETSNGLKAGAFEVVHKVTMPTAWSLQKPEFETIKNIKEEAWIKSGIDNTPTKLGTQYTAVVPSAALHILAFRGPAIRAIGNKTVSNSQMATILNKNPGFLSMSPFDKGQYLISQQGFFSALRPASQGLALGTTTKYPVWHNHLPSVETVFYGVPTGSASLYWIFNGTKNLVYGGGDDKEEP